MEETIHPWLVFSRFLLSTKWEDLFPASFQKALISTAPDLVPIALECDIRFYTLKIFRFEACWLKEIDVDDVARGNRGGIRGRRNPSGAWVDNLRRLRAAFKRWSISKTLFNRQLKERLLHDVDILDKKEEYVDLCPTELETRRILKKPLDEVYHKEELYWKQRVKVTWLKKGDMNTSYFH